MIDPQMINNAQKCSNVMRLDKPYLYHDTMFDFNNQKVSKASGIGLRRNPHG